MVVYVDGSVTDKQVDGLTSMIADLITYDESFTYAVVAIDRGECLSISIEDGESHLLAAVLFNSVRRYLKIGVSGKEEITRLVTNYYRQQSGIFNKSPHKFITGLLKNVSSYCRANNIDKCVQTGWVNQCKRIHHGI